MKQSLAKVLIDRGIINNTTRIIAYCPITAMGNMPAYSSIPLTVNRIIEENQTIKFHTESKTGRRYSVPCEEITLVDGMDPERLAAAYDIKPDGNLRPSGAKRGRKPKQIIVDEL
jgi:hypothetical protein